MLRMFKVRWWRLAAVVLSLVPTVAIRDDLDRRPAEHRLGTSSQNLPGHPAVFTSDNVVDVLESRRKPQHCKPMCNALLLRVQRSSRRVKRHRLPSAAACSWLT